MSKEFPGETKATKGNYIFPNIMAQAMRGVSQRTQYESTMMAMITILIGIMIMAVYICFFTQFSLFMKIMTGVNALAGFVFLSSSLTTTFQMYQAYLQALGAMKTDLYDKSGEEI